MAATKRRRRRTRESGELYQIVQDGNVVAEKQYESEGQALSLAQSVATQAALGSSAEESIEYIVRLVPVLGPPDNLYRVVLTGGEILSFPVAA